MPLSESENYDKVRRDVESRPTDWREVTVAEVTVDENGNIWAIVTENGDSHVEQA